jgi:hypothetical protein
MTRLSPPGSPELEIQIRPPAPLLPLGASSPGPEAGASSALQQQQQQEAGATAAAVHAQRSCQTLPLAPPEPWQQPEAMPAAAHPPGSYPVPGPYAAPHTPEVGADQLRTGPASSHERLQQLYLFPATDGTCSHCTGVGCGVWGVGCGGR